MPVGAGFLLIPVEQFIHLSTLDERIKYFIKKKNCSCTSFNVQEVDSKKGPRKIYSRLICWNAE